MPFVLVNSVGLNNVPSPKKCHSLCILLGAWSWWSLFLLLCWILPIQKEQSLLVRFPKNIHSPVGPEYTHVSKLWERRKMCLDYIFQFPLKFSVANATWAEELQLSPGSTPLNLPNLILSALCPPVRSTSMPGQHWLLCIESGRVSISLKPHSILWSQTGNAFNCFCEGEIDSYFTWACYISLDVFAITISLTNMYVQ